MRYDDYFMKDGSFFAVDISSRWPVGGLALVITYCDPDGRVIKWLPGVFYRK